MDNRTADTLFRTLSDSGRRDVLRLLAEAPLTVGEIVEVLRLPQSTVSRHLKALRETGLLVERREGSRVITSLVEPVINGNRELSDLLNGWVRSQELAGPLRARLRQVLSGRNGEEDAFERLAHRWDDLRRQYFGSQFHLEALCGLLPEVWHVLDIGTGTGYFLPTLSRTFRAVTAVDPSPAMIGLAQERAKREGLKNIRFQLGSLESLPLEASSVDAVLAILVLHHSENIEKAVAELHRVLKPGGLILGVDLAPHDLESFQREMGDPVRGLDPKMLMKQMTGVGLATRWSRGLRLPELLTPGGPEKEAPEMYVIKAQKKDR